MARKESIHQAGCHISTAGGLRQTYLQMTSSESSLVEGAVRVVGGVAV